MAVTQTLVFYPVNTTTVDTGAGIDVRLLDSAQAGADNNAQTATFTHTNDNVERTFDPATGGVTNTNNCNTTLFKAGWAIQLTDMTPVDDVNADAYLPAQTVSVSLVMNATQSGGTYASGTLQPTFKASLWAYNPATDTATLIGSGSSSSVSWNCAATGGTLGTAKTVTFNISVPDTVFGAVKGTAAEILYLQVGFNTGTVPNPTLGTATFTMTMTVDTANTKITLASGLAELFYADGSSSGLASPSGSGALVIPTDGTSSGVATASGSLIAFAETTGTSSGVATASGAFGAVGETTGTISGVATVTGSTALVAPTVGTVNIGAGGGGTTIVKKIFNIFDD